ncbi:MAG: diguanylate cyclase domain-containing protein [Halanaerobium sp.]
MEPDFRIENNLINNLSIGIVITNQSGELLFTNQTIREMTGYTEEEIKTIDDWYSRAYPDPESRKEVKKYFKYDMENNINNRTYKIKTAAGDYKYFNFRYSKLEEDKMLFEIIDISYKIEQKQTLENQKIIFEKLFTNSLEAIALLDQELKILNVNKKFEETFATSEQTILNKKIFDVLNLYKNNNREMRELLEKDNWKDELRFKINDQIKYCNVHIFSVENEEYDKLTYFAVDDITESKKRAKELKEVKERLELAVAGASIGIWDWDVETEYIHYNEHWAEMLGYKISELNNNLNTWLDLVHPEDKKQALNDIQNHLAGKTDQYCNEHRLKTKSGKWKWIRVIGKVTERDNSGNALRIVGVHIDIDQEKRAAQKIEYLSNHDELTGLYNRRYFNEELKRLHKSHKYPISIIVGDLNNLKSINDSYGHIMGDRYIKIIGEVIKNTVREEDIVARVGGDEFAVVLPYTDSTKAESVTERILDIVDKINNDLSLPEPLSIALGYETLDFNSQNHGHYSIKKCYNKADQNMYEQKFSDRV